MTPIVTIRELYAHLSDLVAVGGHDPDAEVVLVSRENGGSAINLGIVQPDGGIDVDESVVFSGIEEI